MSHTTRTWANKVTQTMSKKMINFGLSALALAIALGISYAWLSEPTRPARSASTVLARFVEVMPLQYQQTEPLVQLHGEVIAATAVTLYPQVDGRIVSTNGDLAPGTLVDEGQLLASIDDVDYQLSVLRAEANLANANANYQQELGEQSVASRELNLLTEQLSTELSEQQRQLILRKPQLAQAQADVDSSQAELTAAKLDLSRTQIRAPFTGIISNKYIDVGSQVSNSKQIVDLIDTNTFWIKVNIPSSYLSLFNFADEQPGSGSAINIYIGNQKNIRQGEVYKRLPQLDSATRQAQILLRLDDPLALKDENKGKPQLMVNDYVAIDIIGTPLDNVIVLPEPVVHNGNQIWVIENGELKIHQLDVVWREQERIVAKSDLAAGTRIITTNIANAYNGLKVTTERALPNANAADSSKGGRP